MRRGLFITGTDTGVGKTIVTAALAMILREAGADVGVMKPVATGCVRRREGLVSEDAELLAKAADVPEPLAEISPIRLAEPLAPTVAAARARLTLDLAPMWAAWRRLRSAHDIMLVEGIGGLLCPVTPKESVADLAKVFGLPLLVVARTVLGTINHTALTVEAARARGLRVAGIVINRYHPDSVDLAETTNPDEVQRLTGVDVLGLVPEDPKTDFRAGVVGEDVLAAVRQLPLKKLLA
ncbi:MAG: dethiobiotin synthase [Planctomycetota bacterium]|nr:dethiobiotin synthase [Planctomycetota bacterium]